WEKAVSDVMDGTPPASPAGSSSSAVLQPPSCARRQTVPSTATATTTPGDCAGAAMRRAPRPSPGDAGSRTAGPPAWARSTRPAPSIDQVSGPLTARDAGAGAGTPGT